MNLRTTADLIEDALRKSGEKTDGTSDFLNDAITYMNAHYREICTASNYLDVDLGDPFPWAKAKYPGVVTVQVPYSTGSVTVTQNATAGVFTVPPAASQVNTILKIDGIFEYYRIVAHIGGQAAFTLESPFNDATQTSAFEAIQLDYDLIPANGDQIVRLLGPMKCYRAQTSDADYEGKITGLDIRSFEKKYPLMRLAEGTPTEFAPIAYNNGVPTVRFNKKVSINTKVDYDYIPYPTDLTNDANSIPVIPDGQRAVLSLATAYSILKDKEDNKAEHFLALAQQALRALATSYRRETMQVSKNRGRLLARGDDFGVRNWPTSGDLNS